MWRHTSSTIPQMCCPSEGVARNMDTGFIGTHSCKPFFVSPNGGKIECYTLDYVPYIPDRWNAENAPVLKYSGQAVCRKATINTVSHAPAKDEDSQSVRPLGAPHARKKPRPRRSKRPKVASSVKAAAAPDADFFVDEDDELLEEGDIPDSDDEDPSELAEVVAGPEDWQDGVDAETGKFPVSYTHLTLPTKRIV